MQARINFKFDKETLSKPTVKEDFKAAWLQDFKAWAGKYFPFYQEGPSYKNPENLLQYMNSFLDEILKKDVSKMTEPEFAQAEEEYQKHREELDKLYHVIGLFLNVRYQYFTSWESLRDTLDAETLMFDEDKEVDKFLLQYPRENYDEFFAKVSEDLKLVEKEEPILRDRSTRKYKHHHQPTMFLPIPEGLKDYFNHFTNAEQSLHDAYTKAIEEAKKVLNPEPSYSCSMM